MHKTYKKVFPVLINAGGIVNFVCLSVSESSSTFGNKTGTKVFNPLYFSQWLQGLKTEINLALKCTCFTQATTLPYINKS